MTKRDKLLENIKNNRKNVRFEEIKLILQHFGFEYRQKKTSHVIFVHPEYPLLRVTIPVQKPFIKPIYVELVLECLQELDEKLE